MRQKAQAQELIEASVIAFALFLLIMFFTYQYGVRSSEVKSATESYILGESAFSSLLTLYNSQIPLVKKFVLEAGVDAILQSKLTGSNEPKKVFYGIEIGRVNVSEFIDPVMNRYFGRRWKLVIETPSHEKIEYGGKISGDPLYVSSVTVPFPGLKTGKATLLIGKPQ